MVPRGGIAHFATREAAEFYIREVVKGGMKPGETAVLYRDRERNGDTVLERVAEYTEPPPAPAGPVATRGRKRLVR
jgi:hypothetical protein